MKKVFSDLPRPFQKQILMRIGFGVLFVVVTIALLFTAGDMFTILPAAAMLVFCLGSAFFLFRRGVTGDFVVVSGKCEDMTKTLLTRRIKTIYVKTDQYTLQVSPWQRPRRIPIGAGIELYITPSTPVYERDGVHVLHSYIAMEVTGGVEKDDQCR